MDLLTGLTIYCFGIGSGYMFNQHRNDSIKKYKFNSLQLEIDNLKSQLDIVMDINYNLRKEKHEK